MIRSWKPSSIISDGFIPSVAKRVSTVATNTPHQSAPYFQIHQAELLRPSFTPEENEPRAGWALQKWSRTYLPGSSHVEKTEVPALKKYWTCYISISPGPVPITADSQRTDFVVLLLEFQLCLDPSLIAIGTPARMNYSRSWLSH